MTTAFRGCHPEEREGSCLDLSGASSFHGFKNWPEDSDFGPHQDVILSEKYYYVYLLTNWNNRVIYVGVRSDLRRRTYEHKSKLVKGLRRNTTLINWSTTRKLQT